MNAEFEIEFISIVGLNKSAGDRNKNRPQEEKNSPPEWKLREGGRENHHINSFYPLTGQLEKYSG